VATPVRRENRAVIWREPRGEAANAPRRRDLVYTPNGVLDMTRKPLTRKTFFAQGLYLRVHAWRIP